MFQPIYDRLFKLKVNGKIDEITHLELCRLVLRTDREVFQYMLFRIEADKTKKKFNLREIIQIIEEEWERSKR